MANEVLGPTDLIEAILDWWSDARGDRDRLPWRTTRDPWLTLMSEMMLAQTQVARVAERFVVLAQRFPDAKACAAATQAEVVAHWIGLGYNRRAVSLHQSAIVICDRFLGLVPRTLSELLDLPGVGPYTARAVLAFAFDEPVGVVDTNIRRVLLRAVVGASLNERDTQALADQYVPASRSREWNLAIMDFGSLVCRARNPRCDTCPLARSHCRWRRQAGAESVVISDPAQPRIRVERPGQAFSGSDREGRGRLVRAASQGQISDHELATVAGWPEDRERAVRVAAKLLSEGILSRTPSGFYQLA